MLSYAVAYLPLVEVSVIINVSPVIIAVLGFFLLSEVIKLREIIALLVSFGGITLLICGRENYNESSKGN